VKIAVEEDIYQYFRKSVTTLMIVDRACRGVMWSPQTRELNDWNSGFTFQLCVGLIVPVLTGEIKSLFVFIFLCFLYPFYYAFITS
jgi:hypothetical protein